MNTNLQMVQMGKISVIEEDELDVNENPVWARVIPCTADAMVTPKIRIPYYLRGRWGNLEVDTLVLYFLAEDGSGIILMRMDGEWDGHIHGDVTILEGFLELTEGNLTLDEGDTELKAGNLTLDEGNVDVTGTMSSTGNISTDADVEASGNATITGNVSASGNVEATGKVSGGSMETSGSMKAGSATVDGSVSAASVTASGDVSAGGISLKGHTHPTTTEGAPTGAPT